MLKNLSCAEEMVRCNIAGSRLYRRSVPDEIARGVCVSRGVAKPKSSIPLEDRLKYQSSKGPGRSLRPAVSLAAMPSLLSGSWPDPL